MNSHHQTQFRNQEPEQLRAQQPAVQSAAEILARAWANDVPAPSGWHLLSPGFAAAPAWTPP